jgi:hypothetical protein
MEALRAGGLSSAHRLAVRQQPMSMVLSIGNLPANRLVELRD